MRATEFVESYIDAWNHRDPKAVADHLAAGGVYCDIPENARRSHDELIVNLRDFFSRHRHQYALIGEILKSSNTIAFQYKVSSPGDSDNHDTPGEYHGAEFMTLHGDAAMTITDYYDIPGMARPSSSVAQTAARESGFDKYAKSGLNSEQLLKYKTLLEHIMQSQKAFLKSNLTLPMLANSVGCSVNHLSQVINAGFGMSFFDYLSRFRIEYAQKLLTDDESRSAAILNIAFTVGFNSNSAFYAAFRKYVGQTPAQYRRAQLQTSN